MEDCVKELSKEIKCRDSLIGHLYTLLADEPLFSNLFVHGHVATGKSFILTKVLDYLDYNTCIVNCLQLTSNKSMFEKIIIDLSLIELSTSNNYRLEQRCDDFVEFISRIKLIAQENPKPIVIVLEKCEKLRDMDANVLPVLLKLGELTGSNVCTILSSDVAWEKFYPKLGMYEPIKVHFPQYSQDEMMEILVHLTQPSEYDEDFYRSYLNLFLSIYFRFCRDLHELKYMAEKNFEKYIEPIQNGTIRKDDRSSLWRNISGTFKTNLEVIYLRASAKDFDQQEEEKLLHNIESTVKLALSFELPYYAKFILIAAYLASYNLPKEDRRLFMKEGGPRKRRGGKKKKKTTAMTTREGPRSFPLNRLLNIFCTIIREKIDLNAIVLTQVPTMCQLGLLALMGDGDIEEPKYKCCIDFQFAMVISKNVDFELKKYLCDYIW